MVRYMSLPVRGAWIEMRICCRRGRRPASLPVRGAWIEITSQSESSDGNAVAPRKGSVD